MKRTHLWRPAFTWQPSAAITCTHKPCSPHFAAHRIRYSHTRNRKMCDDGLSVLPFFFLSLSLSLDQPPLRPRSRSMGVPSKTTPLRNPNLWAHEVEGRLPGLGRTLDIRNLWRSLQKYASFREWGPIPNGRKLVSHHLHHAHAKAEHVTLRIPFPCHSSTFCQHAVIDCHLLLSTIFATLSDFHCWRYSFRTSFGLLGCLSLGICAARGLAHKWRVHAT